VLHQKIENAMKPNMQKPAASPAFAERIGRALGRAWRGVLRRERSAGEWLMAQGLPAGIARALPLFLKLAVLALVLYGAFWMALLLGFAFAGAWVARHTDWNEEQEPEWRIGVAGFGLYRGDVQIDIGAPYEEDS
jgi:hypothetical protein